jgi:drug/metabolite transporter (DMT)-like permease
MNETLAAIFAVGSAAAWGAGDFSGGLASKRSHPISVTLVSNPLGLILVMVLALWRGASGPSLHDAILGFSAGMCGALGLLAFYRALSSGKMGVVAPITAVVANVISMLFGAFTEGFPSVLQLIGFALAIVGVYVISKPETNVQVSFADLIPVLIAGVAFGVFFILTGNYSSGDIGWTLVVARLGTISMVVASALWSRHQFKLEPSSLPLVFVAGGMDTVGNLLFALATQMGRLDVGSALSSLYPVTTVLLAMLVLRERLSRSQGIGAVIALVSIPLIVAKFVP